LEEAVVAGGGAKATGVVPVGTVGEPAQARSAGVPPGDAAGTEDRQGSHGTQISRPFVLDVAQGMGLRAVE